MDAKACVFGWRNYATFSHGLIPLIILIPHGGYMDPKDIPDRIRLRPNDNLLNDLNTQTIGRAVVDKITESFGGRNPYLIINHLKRSKVDVNRPLEEGAQHFQTRIAWRDYHFFIETATEKVTNRFGKGVIIDFHGMLCIDRYILECKKFISLLHQ